MVVDSKRLLVTVYSTAFFTSSLGLPISAVRLDLTSKTLSTTLKAATATVMKMIRFLSCSAFTVLLGSLGIYEYSIC